MPTVGSLGWALFADSSKVSAGTKAARRDIRGLRTDIVDLKSATQTLSSTFNTFGVALTGAAIVGGIKSMVSESMEAVDVTAKLSDRLGVATERLTGLRYAASLAGVGADQFDTLLDRMAKTLGDLENRGGAGVETLAKFGLDIGKLASSSPDRAFLEIADAVSKIQSPMERATLATTIFGRQGQELLNTLMQGSDAIEAQIAEADALGLAYSRVDAAQIEAANDAWDRMEHAVGGVATKLSVEMAPIIEQMANRINDMVTGLDTAGKGLRSAEQQEAIDNAGWDSFLGGMATGVGFDIANAEQRRKEEENQRLLDFLSKQPPGPLREMPEDKAAAAAQAAARADMDRAKALEEQRAKLAEITALERENDKLRMGVEQDIARFIDSMKSPAQKIQETMHLLDSLLASGQIDTDTFEKGMFMLKSRAEDLLPKAETPQAAAMAQAVGPIRAGSIEALRAQFAGGSVQEKTLKETEKVADSAAVIADTLGRIEDRLTGISDGSAL